MKWHPFVAMFYEALGFAQTQDQHVLHCHAEEITDVELNVLRDRVRRRGHLMDRIALCHVLQVSLAPGGRQK
jgi:hypothetical protein